MNKIIPIEKAAELFSDGMTVMVGGFLANGSPLRLIDQLVMAGINGLTVICNDTSYPDRGVGKLVANRQVSKLYTSHIGTNPVSSELLNSGEMEIEFCPQGTLAERIRAAGSGLGGVLTPTGLGTMVAEGKRIIEIDDKQFLLEMPLKADIAIIKASVGDSSGNLIYKGTSQNFNPLMAAAADIVIAEVDELVETGELAPENIKTPAIFVDYIIKN